MQKPLLQLFSLGGLSSLAIHVTGVRVGAMEAILKAVIAAMIQDLAVDCLESGFGVQTANVEHFPVW